MLRVFEWSFYLKIAGFFRAVLFSVSMFLVFMSIKIKDEGSGIYGWDLEFGFASLKFHHLDVGVLRL